MYSIKTNENYRIRGFNKNKSYFMSWTGNTISDSVSFYSRSPHNTDKDYLFMMKQLINKFNKLEFYCGEELRDTYIINPIKLKLGVKEFMRTKNN
jgi:hypothetical protein